MWKCPSLHDIPKTGNKECITLGKFVVNLVELFLTKQKGKTEKSIIVRCTVLR